VGLDEMMKFYAERFMEIGSVLTRLDDLGRSDEASADGIVPAYPWRDYMVVLRKDCEEVGLRTSVMAINKILYKLEADQLSFRTFGQATNVLRERISDELSLITVMRIPEEKSALYDKPDAFGSEVEKDFLMRALI